MAEPKSAKTTIAVAVITAITTISGSYFMFKGQSASNTNASIQSFIDAQLKISADLRQRNEELILQNDQLRMLNIEMLAEITRYKADLASQKSEMEVLSQFIKALPIPAWIKEPDVGNTFKMKELNSEYASRYGILRDEYIGKPDAEVYPAEIAAAYLEADRFVASTGEPLITQEMTIRNGQQQLETVVKFRIKLYDGRYAVAGFVFP